MVGRALSDSLSRLRPDVRLLTPSSQELDLRNREAVDDYIHRHRPSVVIHAAGRVGGIAANVSKPVSFLTENMLIGMNVIESAADHGVQVLLNLGSSCMYPRDLDLLRERDMLTAPLEPTNEGYAIAKIAAERLCEYVSRERGLTFRTVIPSNLYGPHDHFGKERSHLVASAIRKVHDATLESHDEVEIWGDGSARREFTYVGDVADWIAAHVDDLPSWPQRLNLGIGVDHTITEYYEAVAPIVGFRGRFVYDLSKPVGMKRKLMDSSLARSYGWAPGTDLESGLRATYNYFLTYVRHEPSSAEHAGSTMGEE